MFLTFITIIYYISSRSCFYEFTHLLLLYYLCRKYQSYFRDTPLCMLSPFWKYRFHKKDPSNQILISLFYNLYVPSCYLCTFSNTGILCFALFSDLWDTPLNNALVIFIPSIWTLLKAHLRVRKLRALIMNISGDFIFDFVLIQPFKKHFLSLETFPDLCLSCNKLFAMDEMYQLI